MEEREIVGMSMLEGVLKNMKNKNFFWDSVCLASYKYGIITFEDIFDAIVNFKVLDMVQDDYVESYIRALKARGAYIPKEEDVHTLQELREEYDILDILMARREAEAAEKGSEQENEINTLSVNEPVEVEEPVKKEVKKRKRKTKKETKDE